MDFEHKNKFGLNILIWEISQAFVEIPPKPPPLLSYEIKIITQIMETILFSFLLV